MPHTLLTSPTHFSGPLRVHHVSHERRLSLHEIAQVMPSRSLPDIDQPPPPPTVHITQVKPSRMTYVDEPKAPCAGGEVRRTRPEPPSRVLLVTRRQCVPARVRWSASRGTGPSLWAPL